MQLNAGVRLLQAQIQYPNSSNTNGPLHLCHTSCALYDGGTLENWLREVDTWMTANPNEVVTILLVNGVGATASTLGQMFTNSGIIQHAYTPTSASPSTWPTLQQMISANTRLVTFIASLNDNTGAEYLLNEWNYMWENNYLVTAASNFTCTPDRPAAVEGSFTTASSSGRMFMMNHFLYEQQLFNIETPDVDNAANTNSPNTNTIGALGTAADDCTRQYGSKPTFVLVDWFNVGPAIETVDRMNGVSDVAGRMQITGANLKVDRNTASANGASSLGGSAVALVLGFGVALAAGLI